MPKARIFFGIFGFVKSNFMAISVKRERAGGLENFRIFGFVKSNFMAISVESEMTEGPEKLLIFGFVKSNFMPFLLRVKGPRARKIVAFVTLKAILWPFLA